MSSIHVPLSVDSIRAALAHVSFVREVVYLPRAGSTNDVARDLGEKGFPHATLVIADDQAKGRGRLGRSWYMPPRSALAMSILVRPDLAAMRANRLTMLAGLAAAEGVERAAGLAVGLKWPNDVVVDDRSSMIDDRFKKVGGILCESAIVGDKIDYAVVGIGLNVNVDFADRPDLAEIATSVMLQVGHEVDRLSVLAAVTDRFAARFAELNAAGVLREAWSARLVTLGRRVEARTRSVGAVGGGAGDTRRIGVAEAVDEDGALLLRTDDGSVHRLLAADVTLRA